MTEIGATLREARMRAKIDITDVELATKIRAKYLRALENEEWNLLPGATFVKSFLRTYADYLGLDSRLLVEEFRTRYEAPPETEASPIRPPLRPDPDRERGRGGPPVPPRAALIGLAVLAIAAALYALGSWGSSNDGTSKTARSHAAPHHRRAARGHARRHAPVRHRPTLAKLQIVATGAVYVCLTDGKGRKLVPGATLAPGQATRTFAAQQLLLTLGNNLARMRVNGKTLGVPRSASPVSFAITSAGRRPLSPAGAPRCA
ncbi:MAG: cytoskeleton protein RodZ [Solirubrobacteraceae bacterium]|nr:cytoskeleton protein RodZ [Solirubrobacteraceae bacterium]